LIETAAAAKEAAKKGDEAVYREVERQQTTRAITAVAAYFNIDPELRQAGALALLSRAHHTQYDLRSGGQPAAANPSARLTKGRRTDPPADKVLALLAFALDLLKEEGGIAIDQAAAKLAKDADKLGIHCHDGTAVTARQISRWRSNLSCAKASKAS